MPNPDSNPSERSSSKSTPPGTPAGKSPRASASSKSPAAKNKTTGGGTIEKNQPRKRVSRREQDAQKTRILYAVLAAAGILIVFALVGQALNQYYFIPNKTLATVNGHEIKRKDYWKYRANTLVNQISQYQQYANFFQGDQQQQYLAMAQQASAQLDSVWGSKSTDAATLNQMIDDRLYIDGLPSLGLAITDQDVQNFIDSRFANPDAPLFTPTATATLIPERAAWATGTVEAELATQTALAAASVEAVVPESLASPFAEGAGEPSPIIEASAVTSPESEGLATPLAPGTPAASPIAESTGGSPAARTPEAAGTPSVASPSPTVQLTEDEIRKTATANFDTYSSQVFKLTHMNRGDYIRLVAKPALARELVNGYFQQQIGQSAEQVHARHILVGTKELAGKLEQELQTDPGKFDELAKENSIDTATAPTGGDLGWFTKGMMVAPFEEVAFSLKPGEISQPVQTQFGWHIIEVIAHEQNRALTDEQITQAVSSESSRWLEKQRDAAKISAVIKPTPTPAIEQFVPPADAPTPPPPSPEAVVDNPVATPTAAG